jgi:N-ethylmaleimide reductase
MYMLFSEAFIGTVKLKNRLVMAPMNRSRALNGVPSDWMTNYYRARASAGLIVAEGTSPNCQGQGSSRIPGIYSKEMVDAWTKIVTATHQAGGKMLLQLRHCGRVVDPLSPATAQPIAPSAVPMQNLVDGANSGPIPAPREMSMQDIKETIDDFVNAAKKAMAAGFDGLELHCANGYLLEQFLRPCTNIRHDRFGGSSKNRRRLPLELVEAIAATIGCDKIGVRISPYSTYNDVTWEDGLAIDYLDFISELNAMRIAHLHIADHRSTSGAGVPDLFKMRARDTFDQALIFAGGYDLGRAQSDLRNGKCDLVAVGRPFLTSPDLALNWQASTSQ